MKIFLICPVRNITYQETVAIEEYVNKLRSAGHTVHWPLYNTDQNDPVGLRICNDNAATIRNSDEVHVWWNEKSQGSVFDLGMASMACAFIPKMKIVVANPEMIQPTKDKSFNNILLAIHEYREGSKK